MAAAIADLGAFGPHPIGEFSATPRTTSRSRWRRQPYRETCSLDILRMTAELRPPPIVSTA
jgi:hypothetical protein